jgi:hypothetical protein
MCLPVGKPLTTSPVAKCSCAGNRRCTPQQGGGGVAGAGARLASGLAVAFLVAVAAAAAVALLARRHRYSFATACLKNRQPRLAWPPIMSAAVLDVTLPLGMHAASSSQGRWRKCSVWQLLSWEQKQYSS